MRPHVICHMVSSLDGRLDLDRWTASPDGDVKAWTRAYEALHDKLDADGWLVGRVTMAEMASGEPHPPAEHGPVERPQRFFRREGPFAIAPDRSAKLHFDGPTVSGAHVVAFLGHDVTDAHLAELAGDGVSYVVADGPEMDLGALLETLGRELGMKRLLLEGGGGINGSFFAEGLVDELSVVVVPALDGSPSRAIVEAGDDGLRGKVELSLTACERLDDGAVWLRYAVRRAP